jgi:hypothetical protein
LLGLPVSDVTHRLLAKMRDWCREVVLYTGRQQADHSETVFFAVLFADLGGPHRYLAQPSGDGVNTISHGLCHERVVAVLWLLSR